MCQFNYGLSWKTTRRYLETFEIMQLCRVDDRAELILEWYDPEALKAGLTPPEKATEA